MGKADRGHPLPQNTCGCPGIDAQVKNLSITNGRVLFIQKGEWDISWTGARILAVLLTVPAKSKTLWKRQHRSRKHRIALTDYHSHPSSLLGCVCDFLFAVLFFRGWVLPASVPPVCCRHSAAFWVVELQAWAPLAVLIPSFPSL